MSKTNTRELIDKKEVIDEIRCLATTMSVCLNKDECHGMKRMQEMVLKILEEQPSKGKYEYHYDHTDCIWYRPEARNRCPVTCAQYRDGWNDCMQYIFNDGQGYSPYRSNWRKEK